MKNLTILTAICLVPATASAAGYNGGGSSVNWSGYYIGVNGGAADNNDRTKYDYSYLHGNGTGNFSDTFGDAADNTGGGGSGSAGPLNVSGLNAVQSAIAQGIIPAHLGSEDKVSYTAGGQIGYNVQNGGMVIGAVADIDWLSKDSAKRFTGTIPSAYTNSGEGKANLDWLSTERLRAGYAMGNLLPYVTGGFAFGGTKASSSSVGTDGSTTDTFAGSDSATRLGWTVGGGLDYMISRGWSLQMEGLYYNLGKVSYNVAAQDANTVAEGVTNTASHTYEGALLRAGLNYAF